MVDLTKFDANVYPYSGVRTRIRYRASNRDKIEKIAKELDKLGIKRSKITEVTVVTYETNIQSKKGIKKLLDLVKWKGHTMNNQVKVDAIKQLFNPIDSR